MHDFAHIGGIGCTVSIALHTVALRLGRVDSGQAHMQLNGVPMPLVRALAPSGIAHGSQPDHLFVKVHSVWNCPISHAGLQGWHAAVSLL